MVRPLRFAFQAEIPAGLLGDAPALKGLTAGHEQALRERATRDGYEVVGPVTRFAPRPLWWGGDRMGLVDKRALALDPASKPRAYALRYEMRVRDALT